MLTARLERKATFAQCFAVSLGCDFAFVASPAGVGGYPATVLLCKRIGIDASRAIAIAVVDQILDLVFFSIAMPLALIWAFTHEMPSAYRLDVGNVAIGAACIGLVALAVAMGRKYLAAIARGLSHNVFAKLRGSRSLDQALARISQSPGVVALGAGVVLRLHRIRHCDAMACPVRNARHRPDLARARGALLDGVSRASGITARGAMDWNSGRHGRN